MEAIKNNWRFLSTLIGIVFAVGMVYSTITASKSDLDDLSQWKDAHEKESTAAFSTIISKLDALKESVDKLERKVDKK